MVKLQAAYFIFMGVWPLLHLKSFEAVTGPKTDKWLVKTIGWLFIVIGLQLWLGSDQPGEVSVLGLGAAAVVGGADVYYSLKGRISRVYLLDVLPQLVFCVWWLVYLMV